MDHPIVESTWPCKIKPAENEYLRNEIIVLLIKFEKNYFLTYLAMYQKFIAKISG